MKSPGAYIIAGLLFFAAFSEAAWAVENRVNPNPNTVPLSSQYDGLIRSPNPIDSGGNLLITGNVRGGRYFRGVVPYRAPTSLGITTPLSSLDSFLRDSVGSEDFGRSSIGYKPYYSPTQTVTTTMPGSYGVVSPPTMNIGGFSAQTGIVGTLPTRLDTVLGLGADVSLGRLRPMSMTTAEIEQLISSEISTYSQDEAMTNRQYQDQVEQFRRDLNQVSDKAAEFEQNLTIKDDFLLPSTEIKPPNDVLQQFETPAQKEQADEESAETPFNAPWALDKQLDVYEQMKQQLDKLQKSLEISPATQQAEDTAGAGEEPAEEQTQEGYQAKKLAEIDLLSTKAKAILGPFETFASFSEDKFNQHMRVGEQYLKQGRYYRAADAYTLASIYKPDDPLAYAGKSHALFASGEYMSSALFLSRALRIFPGYAKFKIDLVAMVGDRDKLETRVADAEEWLGRSGAPELQFLLAYVYYQMDRLQRAKEAINATYEKMPEAPAVLALKKAIEEHKNGE